MVVAEVLEVVVSVPPVVDIEGRAIELLVRLAVGEMAVIVVTVVVAATLATVAAAHT